jgi:hypothetical protein
MLKPKLNLGFSYGHQAVGDKRLHWLEIAIENKGSVAVWNYRVDLKVVSHPGNEKPIDISDCLMPSNVESCDSVIDVGETVFEHGVILLGKSPGAYTFEAIVRDRRGATWRRCLTVANAPAHQTTGLID